MFGAAGNAGRAAGGADGGHTMTFSGVTAIMRKALWLQVVVAAALAGPLGLAGCARGGEQGPVVPEVVLEVTVQFARAINDAFYYYFAFDTDGDFGADGPLPVAAGPRWGNGWGTGSLTHFVEYRQGRYELFRVNLRPELTQAGGGIIGAAGVPDSTDAGTHTITIDTVHPGAATLTGAGTITGVTNNSLQAAGDIAIETDAAGLTVAGSVGFTPAADGGRELTATEQAALDALDAGGVALATDSLAALGLTLTIGAPAAGAQTITIARTVADVTDRFQPAEVGAPVTTTSTLPANNNAPLAGGPIPGMTIRTTDLVAGEAAVIVLEPDATATSLGQPYEFVLPQGGDTLRFTLDLEQLGAGLTDLSINFISTTELIFDPTVVNADQNVYDGLGNFGNDYFTLPTNQFQTIRNQDSFVVEGAGDPTLVGPGTQEDKDSVDIVDWQVTLRRLR